MDVDDDDEVDAAGGLALAPRAGAVPAMEVDDGLDEIPADSPFNMEINCAASMERPDGPDDGPDVAGGIVGAGGDDVGGTAAAGFCTPLNDSWIANANSSSSDLPPIPNKLFNPPNPPNPPNPLDDALA